METDYSLLLELFLKPDAVFPLAVGEVPSTRACSFTHLRRAHSHRTAELSRGADRASRGPLRDCLRLLRLRPPIHAPPDPARGREDR